MKETPLGKTVVYTEHYSPELLCAIDRQTSRESLGIARGELPFNGVDIWNAYELSWLSPSGKPEVACAAFSFPCSSEAIVESKSFKLYLNSLNQTHYDSREAVREVLVRDLSRCVNADVTVSLSSVEQNTAFDIGQVDGDCLDDIDIEVSDYYPNTHCLKTTDEMLEERVYSHLLRSLCPVTGQPDWGTVIINYAGPAIDKPGLLKYLIGYRQHQEFHEQCVERIFMDISRCCQPDKLSVYARYQRRGGLDINPFRSNTNEQALNTRLLRQ